MTGLLRNWAMVALLALLPVNLAIADDQLAWEHFQAGKAHFDAGRYGNAIADFQKALAERDERNGFLIIRSGETATREILDKKGRPKKDRNGNVLTETYEIEQRVRYQPQFYLTLAQQKLAAGATATPTALASVPVANIDPVDRNIPKASATRPGSIAYVIGNTQYHNLAAVDFAVRDARLMERYLKESMGFEQVKVKENLNRVGFNRLFGSASSQYKTGELYQRVALEKEKHSRPEVFIYYAGHGAPSLRENGKPYLVPVDASLDYLEEEAYPLADFYGALAALGDVQLTVVIDSCFSGNTEAGALHKGISPAALKTVSSVGPTNLPNASIFTSAKADEVSYWLEPAQNSLFTHYFLKGLQGNADKDADGRITHGELFDYVSYEVSAFTLDNNKPSRQTPGYSGQGADWVMVE